MKNLCACCVAIFILLHCATSGNAQTITVISPRSGTYVNSIPVVWSISETPGSVQLIFTYQSGFAAIPPSSPWIFMLSPGNTRSSGTFTFNPLTASSNTNFALSSQSAAMPDGIYSVFMRFTRTVNGAIVNSVTSTNVKIDNTTSPGAIVLPAVNAIFNKNFILKDTTPETVSSKKIKFAKGTDTTTLTMSNLTKDSFELNIHDMASSSANILSASANSLADGIYDIILEYKDTNGHDSAVSVTKNITIDTHADPMTIVNPSSDTIVPKIFSLTYSLPEKPLPGSVKAVFQSDSQVLTIPRADTSAGEYTVVFDASDINNPNSFGTVSVSALRDKIPYVLSMTYTDKNGNDAPLATAGIIKVDKNAEAPSLNIPAVASSPLNISYTLPEKALANSVKLIFERTGVSDTVVVSTTDSGTNNIDIIPQNIHSSSGVISSTLSALTETGYAVKMLYTDEYSNVSPVSAVAHVELDFSTEKPVISGPISGTHTGRNFNIKYTLPEKPLAGTVILLLSNTSQQVTLRLKQDSAGSFILPISTNVDSIISADNNIGSASVSTLDDGNYWVKLIYLDQAGNPSAASDSVNVIVDTHAGTPLIISPTAAARVGAKFNLQYFLPEKSLANELKLFLNNNGSKDTILLNGIDSASHTIAIDANNILRSPGVIGATTGILPDGHYNITLFYTDESGNTASTSGSFILAGDSTTQAPLFGLPAKSSSEKDSISLAFILPENALPNSVRLTFNGAVTGNIVVNADTAGNYFYKIPGSRLTHGAGVASASLDSLPNGDYSVMLSYQDKNGNPVASVVHDFYTYSKTDTSSHSVPGHTDSLPLLEFNIAEMKGAMTSNKTDLSWKTIAEKNTSYFEVQQSNDSISFSSIGQVNAANSSVTDRNYHFIDGHPASGTNYYRLRMVDADDVSVYTPIISVYKDKTLSAFKVFPVPATTSIQVVLISPAANTLQEVSIWDNNGRMLKRMKFNTVQGSNIFTIPLNGLASGVYTLKDGDKLASFIKL